MSEIIRDWKRFHARTNHVLWQEGNRAPIATTGGGGGGLGGFSNAITAAERGNVLRRERSEDRRVYLAAKPQ